MVLLQNHLYVNELMGSLFSLILVITAQNLFCLDVGRLNSVLSLNLIETNYYELTICGSCSNQA
jgi:hypothetical protein